MYHLCYVYVCTSGVLSRDIVLGSFLDIDMLMYSCVNQRLFFYLIKDLYLLIIHMFQLPELYIYIECCVLYTITIAYTYIFKYTFNMQICTHAHVYTYTYAHMYTWIYAYTYIYTYVHTEARGHLAKTLKGFQELTNPFLTFTLSAVLSVY